MKFDIQKIKPEWILRVGLGIMYLYSGFSLVTRPELWDGFAPVWFTKFVENFVPIHTYLQIQGGAELIFALVFLMLFVRGRVFKIVASLSVIEMGSILLFSGVDLVTFRDIGLFGASCTLAFFACTSSDS